MQAAPRYFHLEPMILQSTIVQFEIIAPRLISD